MKTAMMAATAGLLLILAVSSASADSTLYSNGSVNGTIGAWLISTPYPEYPSDAVSDSFTLSQTSTVYGIQFGVWAYSGDTLDSLDWSIGTTPFADDSGTGSSPVSQSVLSSNAGGDGIDIDQDSFSLSSPLMLGAGTYYLTLDNAAGTDGDPFFWDENDGPSLAYDSDLGVTMPLDAATGGGSESFSVLSPEPSLWGVGAVLMVGLAYAVRRRHSQLGIKS